MALPPESTSTMPLPTMTAPPFTTAPLAISTRLPGPLASSVPESKTVPLTIAVPLFAVCKTPPEPMDVVTIAVPPPETVAVPPLKTVGPTAVPPLRMVSLPPEICAPKSAPWALTISLPPLRTIVRIGSTAGGHEQVRRRSTPRCCSRCRRRKRIWVPPLLSDGADGRATREGPSRCRP